MSSSRLALVLSLALATAACGGATPHTDETASSGQPTASASPSPEDLARPFAIAPLHLRSLPNAARAIDIELHTDGTVTVNGELAGRLEGARVLGADGAELFAVGAGGVLSAHGQQGRARMLANGDIEPIEDAEHQSRIEIAADGTPQERHADGRVEQLPARFEGLTPETRRSAMAITMMMIASSPQASSAAPSVEVAASVAPSAAPASAAPSAAPTTTRRRRAAH